MTMCSFKYTYVVSNRNYHIITKNKVAFFNYILLDIDQVWFQNQRAKMKKIQKKARQENKNNKDDDCSDDKSQKTKVKEEEQSKLSIYFLVTLN